MWNTVAYMIGIPIGMALSLLLALALNQKLRFEGFFRTVYFLPSVCSVVVLALLWKWIYNADYGLIHLYQSGFQYFQMGYASAMAWVLAAIVMAITWFQFNASKRWVHYD